VRTFVVKKCEGALGQGPPTAVNDASDSISRVKWSVPSLSDSKMLVKCRLGDFGLSGAPIFFPEAFIDSGCSAFALISKKFVSLNKLSIIDAYSKFYVSLADGSHADNITKQTLPLQLSIGSHVETICFLVADIHCPIILGLPWLRMHNPQVNWRKLMLTFNEENLPPYSPFVAAGALDENPSGKPRASEQNDFGADQGVSVCFSQIYDTIPTEQPTAKSPTDIELLNAPEFFKFASDQGLYVFAAQMDVQPSHDGSTPLVSISSVLTTKDYQKSDIRTDERGVPFQYQKFSDVFAPKTEPPRPLPPHRQYDLGIEIVKDENGKEVPLPSAGKVYPISPAEEKVLQEYLTNALARGWITNSTSPVAAPCFFVKKPNGGFRLCIDYRAINSVTIKNKYPLPLLADMFPKLGRAKIFTHLDLPDAYHLVRIRPGDEWKTAFRCKFGHFQYNVISFGLSNAPSAFQYFMNDILSDMLGDSVVVYLDDILIYSESEEEHAKHVAAVLQRLRKHTLQVNPAKCSFHTTSTDFLGHIFSSNGVSMDPAKVSAVADWPQPTSVKEIQVFLGFANFYRQFIQCYSELVQPLTSYTRSEFKFRPFLWTNEADLAFKTLKSAFASAPILRIFDPSKTAIVETDCSDFAMGAILSQLGDDKQLHPIAFHSRKLLPAEVNYDTHDKELLAVIDAFSVWRHYLIAVDPQDPVIVLSDHERLQRFAKTQQLTRRQYRWAAKLSEFSFKIIHRPGRLSGKPDALSRRPDLAIAAGDLLHKQNFLQLFERVDVDAITILTSDEAWLNSIRTATADSDLLSDFHEDKLEDKFTFERGLLHYNDLICLPTEELQVEIFRRRHCSPASGHFGIHKTVELITRDYWFPRMRRIVRKFILNCEPCQRSKHRRHAPYGLLQPLPVPEERWWDISMDFITDLPLSRGFDTLMVVKDRLSKQAHFIPTVKTATGADIADLYIRDIFRLHGASRSIVSDRDPKFTSSFWRRFMELLHVKVNLSTAFHPQTDGSTEITNQVIEQYLRVFCNYQQNDWVAHLPLCEFAYNDSEISTTGMTPFFANSGHHPIFDPTTIRAPLVPAAEDRIVSLTTILQDVRANLAAAQKEYTKQANRSRLPVPDLEIDDLVFLDRRHIKTSRPSSKLDDKNIGPFRITRKINNVAYELKLPATMKIHPVFHASLLEPKTKDIVESFVQQRPPPIIVDNEVTFEVEEILDSGFVNGKLHYFVHWKGYPIEERSWQPKGNLKNAPNLVEDFHNANPDKPRLPPPSTRLKKKKRRG
jgi:hypothetical protein